MAYQRAEFRSSFGRVITVIIASLMALSVVSLLFTTRPSDAWWALPMPVLVATTTWVVMWRPRVVIDRDEVLVVNPFATFHVPWGAIVRIDTKWALELFTREGKITAFAAPAPSRYGVASISTNDIRLARESSLIAGGIRPGDSLQSVSGAAAHVTRTTWEEMRDDGLLKEQAPATRTLHWASILLLAIPAALTALGLLVR